MFLRAALVSFTLMTVSCGVFKKDKPKPKQDNIVSEAQKQQLIEMREDVRLWARGCSNDIACGTKADGSAEDGDSVLWAGLLCLSGESNQCQAVRASVGDDGSLHRNPDQDRTKNSFSRDMFLGFLAYLAKTGDNVTGNLVYDHILKNEYKLCTDADNNRCNVFHDQYNAVWNLWYEIREFHKQAQRSSTERGKNYGGELLVSLQSIFAAEGYPRHLVAVELYVHQEVNDWSIIFQNAANQLVNFQPDNPFFEYLANGPTSRAAQLTLDKCPREQPQPTSNDWAWQRDESEQAWKKAKGWDCIFMANILLKR